MEVNFVSCCRTIQVFQSDIHEMTQSSLVSFHDQFTEHDVVFEGSKPEIGDSSFCPFHIQIGSSIGKKGCSTRIILESLGFSSHNLIGAWFYGTINNIKMASYRGMDKARYYTMFYNQLTEMGSMEECCKTEDGKKKLMDLTFFSSSYSSFLCSFMSLSYSVPMPLSPSTQCLIGTGNDSM
jgi:hypothetical protein